MAKDLVRRCIDDAISGNGSYAEFTISSSYLAFTSDSGKRKSTRKIKLDGKNLTAVERTLKGMDERSILFTGSLRRIRIVLSDGREAEFLRKDNHYISFVTGKKTNETRKKEYLFARFLSEKNVRYGVAFGLRELKGTRQISPCKGIILNGAFDSEISTDLQFVMSGDFYGREAVPDMKYSKRNEVAVKVVSDVLESAIGNMLQLGLLSNSLFSILPSSLDEDSEINMEMIDAARRACSFHPMFRSTVGTIVGKNRAIMGTNDVVNLFPQAMIDSLFNEKCWIEGCIEGSREEYFLMDIGIPFYDREKFLSVLFIDENMDELSEILSKQKDKWLREFYIFCSKPIIEEETKRKVISAFRNMRSIRDSKGKMYFPYEIYIRLKDEDITNKSVVIKDTLINPAGEKDKYSEQLQNFFLNDIGVETFNLKPEMEILAQNLMKKKQPIDRLYCEKLVTLAKYDEKNRGTIDFSQYAIFPYASSKGLKRAYAYDLVIGKPYVKEGILLAKALNRKNLWKGLQKLLKDDDLQKILGFAANCGAIGKATIVQQRAEFHVNFAKKLYAPGRQGVRDSNYDYTIPGLGELLRRRSLQLSKMVWLAISEEENPIDVLYAEYSVENRKIVNRDDSSLVKILRERTWVPGKDGKFYKPGNIFIEDINEGFAYNRKSPIFKQLCFGKDIKEKERRLEEMKNHARKEGFRLIPEEEYREFLKWKKEKI